MHATWLWPRVTMAWTGHSLRLSFSSVNGDNSACWTYVPGVLGEENEVCGSARYYINDTMTSKMEIRVGLLGLVNLPTCGL